MSITYDDDDFDYKNVKPGDISNIFEEDDEEDFEYDETDDDSEIGRAHV